MTEYYLTQNPEARTLEIVNKLSADPRFDPVDDNERILVC